MAYKILTVDDSTTIRKIVKRALDSFNCEILEAQNGVEGLAMANKEKPDLILLDITMPVMTGVEMLERLKAQQELKEIPVIMLTAESGKESVTRAVRMGIKDYIVKPFKGPELVERIQKHIRLTPKP
jgi:DNA-binding response OmpR family regulator